MTKPVLALALPALLTTFVACATTSRIADSVGDVAADALLPVKQENELGKEMSAELEKEVTLHPDDAVQTYIGRLGKKAAKAAAKDVPDGIRFRFRVIQDDDMVNAFAMPGGYIYVYTGLLKKADNEAEVMGVLGHEVGHVTQRHVAKRLIALYGLDAVTKMALGEDPGLLGELISAVVAGGTLLKYSRDQERESDIVGLGYVKGAGYDPNGFITFFEKLKSDDESSLMAVFQSHPMPGERITYAKTLIKGMKKKPSELGEDEFAAFKGTL
jgi:predicted Zn-dependent protease